MHTDHEDEGAHVDEGTIHAWLDGALGEADAERVEAHVHGCRECTDAVAEARGFIAGASRVIGLLDEEPAAAVKPVGGSAWRFLRVTPMRASIAAALIVAVGLTFTRPRAAVEPGTRGRGDTEIAAVPVMPDVAPDTVLSSAVAKRIAEEHPARVMRASPEPVVTASAPPSKPAEAMGREPAAQVAAGAAMSDVVVTAMGEAPADKLRASAPGVQNRASGECYRLDGPVSADWKGVPMPLTIQLSNALAAGGAPEVPRYGVTAVGGARLIGSYARVGEGVEFELVGETAVTTGALAERSGTLTASGKTITVRARRVSCR